VVGGSGRNPEYILTGILRCALWPSVHAGVEPPRRRQGVPLYRCSTRDKKGKEACASAPLPAMAIEGFVVQRVREALADGKLVKAVAKAAKERLETESGPLEGERAKLPLRIATLSTEGKRLPNPGGVSAAVRRLSPPIMLTTETRYPAQRLGSLILSVS